MRDEACARERTRKKKGSCRYKRLTKQISDLHEQIANVRKDFIHKETAKLVETCAVIATEELKPKNMSGSAKGTVENPERYLLIIEWETLENRTKDFRESGAFKAWRDIVGSYFSEPPVVEHFKTVA